MTINAESLRGLSRPALQKFAMANHVKANLKSETIISLLVEKHLQETSGSCRKSLSPAQSKKLHSAGAHPPSAPKPLLRGTGKTPVPPNDDDVDRGIHTSMRRSLSQTTFNTPESSPEHTPEPALPEDHALALTIMTTISSADTELFPQIEELLSLATVARKQVGDLRSLLRAERGLRKRLEAYVRYWREIPPGWSARELWGDRMRVRLGPGNTWVELSSDEESDPEDTALPEGALATLKPGQQVPSGYLGAETSVARSHGSTTDKVNANGKRSREEDESDSAYHDARYHARKRFEGNGNGSTRTMQAPASLTPLDKGKRKMTAAEVEKSIREDEQMSHHSRPQPNRKATALRRTEEAIELDTTIMAAPARADHRHLINSTSSQQLPSPDVLVPRPNHKDSRKQVGR